MTEPEERCELGFNLKGAKFVVCHCVFFYVRIKSKHHPLSVTERLQTEEKLILS